MNEAFFLGEHLKPLRGKKLHLFYMLHCFLFALHICSSYFSLSMMVVLAVFSLNG